MDYNEKAMKNILKKHLDINFIFLHLRVIYSFHYVIKTLKDYNTYKSQF
jgi:hypothetical protein